MLENWLGASRMRDGNRLARKCPRVFAQLGEFMGHVEVGGWARVLSVGCQPVGSPCQTCFPGLANIRAGDASEFSRCMWGNRGPDQGVGVDVMAV